VRAVFEMEILGAAAAQAHTAEMNELFRKCGQSQSGRSAAARHEDLRPTVASG